jgi:serine/threonine protein kinase
MNGSNQREAAIFDAAHQFPTPEQRAAYLQGACGDDAALRRRIEALLESHDQAGDFLENAAPSTGVKKTIVLSLTPTEKEGDRIGRYKLLQQIGEGGCGVVYMAEQEEPVRRRVALKVIKLGMDTKSVIARFEAERQALAMMDHPNIAKVLDAGATETGRPFFVMELVRGIKITEYCDQNKLSTDDRLKLFVQVCRAIQHAHQKGIIHRDIKPSNILVTLHDGVPVPKVIDFGIAKATQGRLTDQTLFTAFEQFIGTPAYMSPEQAEMSGLDIDTRSDIYSLGVLLYELLTSKTPFDSKELIASGLDAMRHTIREREPERPSTRLSTMLNADLSTTADQRRTDAPKLIHLLRGDLDWIVMKALEKDRTRRFETANGLAMDVQRYLQNEPVVARPPSTVYRFQKLVRRNKTVFAALGTGVAALIVGLALSLTLFVRERTARQRAVAAEREQTRMRQEAEAHAQWGNKLTQAGLLLMRGDYGGAERLVNEVPPLPAMVAFYDAFGDVHARRGEWRIAITNFTMGTKLVPSDHFAYHYLAPLLVQIGDLDGYRQCREQILRQFETTSDPTIAERMAKACLILAPSTADFSAINRLVDTAVAAGSNHVAWGYFQFAKGLSEYRQGRFASAAEWLETISPQKRLSNRNAQTSMVLAMAQYQIGWTDEARATLAQGLKTAEQKLDKLQSGLGEDWNDWLIAQTLMSEAKTLIAPSGSDAAAGRTDK